MVNKRKVFHDYYIMTDFHVGAVCVPTAATNLLFHYQRAYKACKKLKAYSWDYVFNNLFLKMETNARNNVGTLNYKTAPSIDWFCREKAGIVSKSSYKKERKKGESIVQELDKSRPCIVHTIGHSTYGNHAALALGYEKIVSKKNGKNITDYYFRIADGWSKSSQRYIWGGYSSYYEYTTVNIATK